MRVLIDTNIYISFLLNPKGGDIIPAIFSGWVEGMFTILVSESLLEEIQVTVSDRPHLVGRIPITTLGQFLSLLREESEMISPIEESIPAVTRDPKDDYLLAYALVGKADYLVTGDKDLLVLQAEIPDFEIVSPRQFSEILSS